MGVLDDFLTPDTVAAIEATAPPAPKTVKVVYVGPHPAGEEIAESGQWANPGETVEVREELAGRPPSGTPGEDGYDMGAGLLANTECWTTPRTKAARVAKEQAAETAPDQSEEPSDG